MRYGIYGLLIGCLLVAVPQAGAETVQVDFTGTVTASYSNSGLLTTANGAVNVGDAVSGRFIYDTNTADANPDVAIGSFDAISYATLTTGANTYEAIGGQNLIDVRSQNYSTLDQTEITLNAATNLTGPSAIDGANTYVVSNFNLVLIHPDANYLAHVNTVPDAATFSDFVTALSSATGEVQYTSRGADQFNFSITSITATPVPEPASAALLAIGAGAMAVRRRRKR